jgi:hypothetical protein
MTINEELDTLRRLEISMAEIKVDIERQQQRLFAMEESASRIRRSLGNTDWLTRD